MASVRPDQIQGLPANCSDMSDMLVCLVTPHSSTVTKVGPTPLWNAWPKWLWETWGVTEPQSQGQECTPRPPFKASPPFSTPVLLKLSVHLILLQFHLSPPKPSNQHPLSSLQSTHTHTYSSLHFPLWILPSFSISKPHTCYSPPLGPSPPQPPSPSTHFGCYPGVCISRPSGWTGSGWFPKVGTEGWAGTSGVEWCQSRDQDLCVCVFMCVHGVSAYQCVCMCRSI